MLTKIETELNDRIDSIFKEASSFKNIKTIPKMHDYRDYKGVFNIECAVLFADLGGTTELVDKYDCIFSSWVLKSYLTCVSVIINHYGGKITAFEGDGLMALFSGKSKESDAVKCAFQIQWTVSNILQPKLNFLFPEKKYIIHQVVGIDSSKLTAIKTGIWNEYDLLWVGRAANYAANLTCINNIDFSTYITSDVYLKLTSKLQGSEKNKIWDLMTDRYYSVDIFRSCKMIQIEL